MSNNKILKCLNTETVKVRAEVCVTIDNQITRISTCSLNYMLTVRNNQDTFEDDIKTIVATTDAQAAAGMYRALITKFRTLSSLDDKTIMVYKYLARYLNNGYNYNLDDILYIVVSNDIHYPTDASAMRKYRQLLDDIYANNNIDSSEDRQIIKDACVRAISSLGLARLTFLDSEGRECAVELKLKNATVVIEEPLTVCPMFDEDYSHSYELDRLNMDDMEVEDYE